MKAKNLLAIRAAVSVGLMSILIYMARGSIPKMFDAIRRLSLAIFLVGLCIFFISIFIISFRLKLLLFTQNIFLNIVRIANLTFIGYFFSSFLPTAIGGDVVKAFYISKTSNKSMQSYTSVFIDRFLGMCTMFLIAAGALIYTKEISGFHFKWVVPLLLMVCGLFLIFLFNKRLAKALTYFLAPLVPAKIKEKLKSIYNAMHDFRRHKLAILGCIFISMAGQILAFSATYVFARGLNSYIPLKLVLLVMSVASMASMLPSIYGTGPREMAIVIILSPFLGKDKALAVAFLWLGVLLATALTGGIIYILTGQYKVKPGDLRGENGKFLTSSG